MPVIVASQEEHPFLPTLGSGAAISATRAAHQDIRPLEIVIVNLMADKLATERQLALWLGHTPLQVHLTFAATDSYVREIAAGRESRNTPAEHIRKFYSGFSEIAARKFDGLIVTGVNALAARVSDEAIWPEVRHILNWSNENVLSSLFLCWGAQAALLHFHDVDSIKGAQKIYGLFDHRIESDKTGLLFGFPDIFPVPVSRWKHPGRAALAAVPGLEAVASCAETGPNILAEPAPYDNGARLYPRRVYILNHPEYETDRLQREFLRDSAKDPAMPPPQNYFPGGDAKAAPVNLWRHTAHIYSNWVKAVYEATPYDRDALPRPFNACVAAHNPLARLP